jgi:hypothetical protein
MTWGKETMKVTVPLVSTNGTTTSHLKALNTKKDHDIGNPDLGLGQA